MNLSNKPIILISQSACDVISILELYEKYNSICSISIYVIKNKNLFDYFNNLNLNVKYIKFIEYVEYFNIKKPLTIIKAKKDVKMVYKKYFTGVKNSSIYFFADTHDFLTFYIVNQLCKRNEITFYDWEKYDIKKSLPLLKYSLGDIIVLLSYIYIVGNRLVLTQRKAIRLLTEKQNIKVIRKLEVSIEVREKYCENININKEKAVLIFESPTASISINNYENTLEKIISIIKEMGLVIYIKPHPYKGFSNFLSNLDVIICDSKFPGELINTNEFSYILGITSLSIARLAKFTNNVYSLIDLMEWKNSYSQNRKNEDKERLLMYSNNQINIIGSFKDLKHLI